MRPSERPSPAVVLPTVFVVAFTVEPTADVVLPTVEPTVEVVEFTTPPTPPSRPPLLDAEPVVVARPDPLALVANMSSLPALALVLALVIELIVAAIGIAKDPCSRRSKIMPTRDSPLSLALLGHLRNVAY